MSIEDKATRSARKRVVIPQIDPSTDALEAALRYADAGLYVLPVVSGQKNPGSVVGAGWTSKSSRDVEQICTWFAGTTNGIALHLGPSGLLAIDVDYPETLCPAMSSLLATSDCPFQSTRHSDPRRGHYLFRLPPGVGGSSSPGNLGHGWGDVRGGNAVIIAAPSQHGLPDGRYRWIRSGEIPTLPRWLEEQLRFSSSKAPVALADDEIFEHIESWGSENWFGELLSIRLGEVLWQAGSRHDRCQKLIVDCLMDARVGAYPARVAVRAIYESFVAAKPQEIRQSIAEFRGMTRWATAAVAGKTATEISRYRQQLEIDQWIRSDSGERAVRRILEGGDR